MRSVRSLLAAVLVMAASGTGLLVFGTAAPARAAACSGSTGVTAIVDFNELGGGLAAGCDPDGHGQTATRVFTDAGYTLSPDPRSPGFICQVNGKPAAGAECSDETAYWSLWWSDGVSGQWVYSQQGSAGLRLRDGYYVAWSWHEGAGKAQAPDVNPTPHQQDEPTKPTDKPAKGGKDKSDRDSSNAPKSTGPTSSSTPSTTGTPEATDGESSTPSAAPDEKDSKKRKDGDRRIEPVAPAPTDPSYSALPEAGEITAGPDDVDSDTGGSNPLPTILGVSAGVVVLGAAAAVPLLRRRRTP